MRRTTAAPDLMPILSPGRHRSAARGACFMEYASYLAGERWSDHPACTHALLAALARDVNDLTTAEGRGALVPLIPRVVGLDPADAEYGDEIAALAAAAALPVVSLERQRALAVGLLSLARRSADPRISDLTRSAFDSAPDAERWAVRYLDRSRAPHGSWARATEAIVHTAAVGIALACIDDPDAVLRSALVAAIEAAERRMPAPRLTREAQLIPG
ncbi:hypothetical protein [Antiquaquibacter soli]|uniref:HEAT repeat domain-containing protein n=1 Tax=Antiquaquibacter soli TaxID=3064523 RepID=A0ABT9BMT3_9MICO|nr:hypothetical protein [Protaetiibacter sp. WY-16]MDO7882343.1 hypothetical protein [Protaetiibacter sp. WY-16]